jgi:hypothetical protein
MASHLHDMADIDNEGIACEHGAEDGERIW